MTRFNVWQAQKGLQPPVLVPLIGKRVLGAWVSPSGSILFLHLADDAVLMAKYDRGFGTCAIQLDIGTAEPDKDWSAMDGFVAWNQYTDRLIGRKMTGMDGDVLMFGDVGAQFTPVGIQWVRVRDVSFPNPRKNSEL